MDIQAFDWEGNVLATGRLTRGVMKLKAVSTGWVQTFSIGGASVHIMDTGFGEVHLSDGQRYKFRFETADDLSPLPRLQV